MEANHPVNEEPYEVCLDNHGCLNGPKTGRLRFSNNVRIVVTQVAKMSNSFASVVSLLCLRE